MAAFYDNVTVNGSLDAGRLPFPRFHGRRAKSHFLFKNTGLVLDPWISEWQEMHDLDCSVWIFTMSMSSSGLDELKEGMWQKRQIVFTFARLSSFGLGLP